MKILGWLMLAIPFVVLFFMLWRVDSIRDGLKGVLIFYGVTAAAFIWLVAAIKIISGVWL